MRPIAAAATGALTTTTSNPIYLTLQIGPSGTALVVSSTPSPFPNRTITRTREAFKTFRLFMLHVLGLNNGTPHLGIGRISPIRDTTLEILYFLYADIAQLIAPQLSPQEQLECTAVALCAGAPVRDFSVDLKASSLVNAALNANLDEVCDIIINKTHPEKRDALLREYRTATVNGIERFGTALQMALFSGDEAMAKALQPHMDSAEFQRQWIEVFGTNYNAFLERQKNQAVALCAELQIAFNPESANKFRESLTCYVRANPVHNPFILQTLFEIYDRLLFDSKFFKQFPQLTIWPAEKLSSAAMLQHLAQGIYQIVEQNAPLDRSFLLQGGAPRVDIRSLVDSSVNCFVDIRGRVVGVGGYSREGVGRSSVGYMLSKLLSSKTSSLGETYAASDKAPVCNSVTQ